MVILVVGHRLSTVEVRKRAAKRKRASDKSLEILPSPNVPKPSKGVKETSMIKMNDQCLPFPEDFLACDGVNQGVWPTASSLAFPAALRRLEVLPAEDVAKQGIEHTLQALQHFFALKTRADTALEAYKRKTELLTQEVEEWKAKAAASEERRKAMEMETALKQDDVERLEKRVKDMAEEMLDLESLGEVKGRAKMAWELYSLKGSLKDVREVAKKETDFYLTEIGGIADLTPPEAEAQATLSTADSTRQGEVAADGEAAAESLVGPPSTPI